VIAHLWEELGPRFPSMLNGMFAIALHDVRAKRVVLVRDHFGIKRSITGWSMDAWYSDRR